MAFNNGPCPAFFVNGELVNSERAILHAPKAGMMKTTLSFVVIVVQCC